MDSAPRPTWIAILMACLAGLLACAASTGCDENYVAAGDFLEPSVQPMDFSPYGYDYSVYDVLTEE